MRRRPSTAHWRIGVVHTYDAKADCMIRLWLFGWWSHTQRLADQRIRPQRGWLWPSDAKDRAAAVNPA